MKNITNLIFGLLLSAVTYGQGYFTGTLDSEGNELIFKVMVNNADISDGSFTSVGITIRVADGQEFANWGEITSNTADFPLLNIAVVDNPFGSEPGFTSYLFSFSDIAGTSPTSYTNATEYELFRVEAEGTDMEVANFQASHNEFEDVDQFYIAGGGESFTDPSFSTYFYGADVLDSYVNTDGATVWTVEKQNVALPIKMKSFTAVPFENRDANLDWVTASEINASHFEVERSDDGINFTQIGRVEATGNSTTDQDYKYADRDINIQRNDVVQYYRIKMIDIDGEYKYSGVRVVNFTRSNIDFAINTFPNPTTDFVQLELTGLDNTSTERPSLMIFSNTGELVRSMKLNSDLGKVDMSDLPGSLYHFMIQYKGQKYNEKIVVVK